MKFDKDASIPASLTMKRVKQQIGLFFFFFLVALCVNLVCSCFSPLFSLALSTDSACFYMQGHAWAEGLTPYVDFIDVKGPLLFFLFKLACHLTANSTLGAYFLYSCAVAATLFFTYRTALLLLEDGKKAVVAAMAILPVLFWWQTYLSGGESEELMSPFYALLLYTWLRYMQKTALPSSLKALSFCIGLGAGVTLLIKYNCTFVFLIAFIVLGVSLVLDRRLRALLTQCLPCVLLAFCIVVLPFVMYLWHMGALQACWDVYVTLNFSTYFGAHTSIYSTGDGITKILSYAEMMFRCREGMWVLASMGVACFYPFPMRGDKKRCFMFMIILFAAFVSCMGRFHDYYMLFCAPCCIIPVALVLRHVTPKISTVAMCACGIGFMYIAVRANGQWAERAPLRVTQKLTGDVAKVEKVICCAKNPKILYLGALDRGFGVSAGALPATPEWCTLNGVDEAFAERQRQAVVQRKADFIVVLSLYYGAESKTSSTDNIQYTTSYDALCRENGYFKVCSFVDGKHPSGLFTLYSKKKLKSSEDSLLK